MAIGVNKLNHKIKYLITKRIEFIKKPKWNKKLLPRIDWKINFGHKIIGDINIFSLIKDKKINLKLPDAIRNKFTIRPYHTYCSNIGRKILNYNKILRDLNYTSYDDILNSSCIFW